MALTPCLHDGPVRRCFPFYLKRKKQIEESLKVLTENNKSVQREWKKSAWELQYGGSNLTLTVLIIVSRRAYQGGKRKAYREAGWGEKIPLPESACSVRSPAIAPMMPTAVQRRAGLNREAWISGSVLPPDRTWYLVRKPLNLSGPHSAARGHNDTSPAMLVGSSLTVVQSKGSVLATLSQCVPGSAFLTWWWTGPCPSASLTVEQVWQNGPPLRVVVQAELVPLCTLLVILLRFYKPLDC